LGLVILTHGFELNQLICEAAEVFFHGSFWDVLHHVCHKEAL